ncbi:hypothetical protein E2C01_053392 [Portunus trituberculatus]|uniref:Uncharacterized protein n=1 Tax=Portunus trituberculatus TaxID=210409 RepID=A0A5B7GP77_PORTR|nr:hypothetical protein [Portunus trituberculatus]
MLVHRGAITSPALSCPRAATLRRPFHRRRRQHTPSLTALKAPLTESITRDPDTSTPSPALFTSDPPLSLEKRGKKSTLPRIRLFAVFNNSHLTFYTCVSHTFPR